YGPPTHVEMRTGLLLRPTSHNRMVEGRVTMAKLVAAILTEELDDVSLGRTSGTHVSHQGNAASRADPARGRRKLPPAPADPRSAGVGKPCSGWGTRPISAQPGNAMSGLSRRRSRARVPSVPSLNTTLTGGFSTLRASRPLAPTPVGFSKSAVVAVILVILQAFVSASSSRRAHAAATADDTHPKPIARQT